MLENTLTFGRSVAKASSKLPFTPRGEPWPGAGVRTGQLGEAFYDISRDRENKLVIMTEVGSAFHPGNEPQHFYARGPRQIKGHTDQLGPYLQRRQAADHEPA